MPNRVSRYGGVEVVAVHRQSQLVARAGVVHARPVPYPGVARAVRAVTVVRIRWRSCCSEPVCNRARADDRHSVAELFDLGQGCGWTHRRPRRDTSLTHC